ncbi:MAG: hypothetical protein ABIO76_08495 [Ginsengibacter sp.]
MERLRLIFLVVIVSVAACNHSPEVRKTDPLESGRGFIEASLKGDYDEAKKYLLQDSTNIEYFNGFKDFNNKRNEEEKKGYRDANIIIDSTQKISDSVTIISYSNTYKMKPSSLKLVKHDKEWLVDFKYTFTGNR